MTLATMSSTSTISKFKPHLTINGKLINISKIIKKATIIFYKKFIIKINENFALMTRVVMA